MDIDFVVPWVDGNDVEWLKQKEKYKPSENTDARNNRYRDWDNLQYWFRGVEKFTPWVRKIHFVTWGHLPEWLNVNNPKLHIVNHEDYIQKDYLPTFNSHTIELNIHRIKGLAENFVYFNDDMFIIKPIKIEDFFKNGLPCDVAILDAIGVTELFSYILVNNIKIINKNFNKKKVLMNNKLKWFNPKYGKELYRTLSLYPWKNFTGFYNPHLPIAYKKETFKEVWKKEYRILDETSKNKFRSITDVSGWLFRYWRIVKGEFYPQSISGKHYDVCSKSDCVHIYNTILNQKCKMICINDSVKQDEFEDIKNQFNATFEKILPEKSSFEL